MWMDESTLSHRAELRIELGHEQNIYCSLITALWGRSGNVTLCVIYAGFNGMHTQTEHGETPSPTIYLLEYLAIFFKFLFILPAASNNVDNIGA